MKRVFVIGALLIFGLAALEASAHGPGMHGRHHWKAKKSPDRDRLAALDLSQEQRDRIAEVRESHKRGLIQSQADLKLARLELRKQLRSEKPDQDAIDDQIDRVAAIRADMMKSRVDQHLEVRGILTPLQRNQLRGGRGSGSDEAPPRDQDPRRM